MALDDVRSALELVQQDPDSDFVGERNERTIAAAEAALGLRFPPSYRLFLSELGAGNIGSEEIYGVIDENFVDSGVPDAIWMTLGARSEWDLPKSMVVIYFDGGTDYYVIDTSDEDAKGESPVLVWRPGVSKAGDALVHVAPHFGAFLLDVARRTAQSSSED